MRTTDHTFVNEKLDLGEHSPTREDDSGPIACKQGRRLAEYGRVWTAAKAHGTHRIDMRSFVVWSWKTGACNFVVLQRSRSLLDKQLRFPVSVMPFTREEKESLGMGMG